jgi:hypothetical protein
VRKPAIYRAQRQLTFRNLVLMEAEARNEAHEPGLPAAKRNALRALVLALRQTMRHYAQ